MGDMSSGDVALLLWGVYFVVLLFRMVWWCAAATAKDIGDDILATVDHAIKRGTEQGVELAKKDAKRRRDSHAG